MPSATLLVLIFGLVFFVSAAVGIVWWASRSSANRHRDEGVGLPLFSVSLTESRWTPAQQRPAISAQRSAGYTNGSHAAVAEREPVAAHRAATDRLSARESEPFEAVSPPAAPVRAAPARPEPAPKVAVPKEPVHPKRPSRTPPKSNAVPAPETAAEAEASVPAQPTPLPETPSLPDPIGITAHGVPGTQVEGHLLRYSVPQEGTLQFLPGRLEILNGLDTGREVRFVRVPGPDGTEVTFGRSEGPAYKHVQLREGTVSRAHARMRLSEGQWHLTNLSATNPVVYNDRTLAQGEEQPIADGDRIEMGEVVFGFRSR